MPPRRGRKVGSRRIDAALDAVRPLGFPAPLVREVIRRLLQTYDGEQGWIFIEEASYKLLIDSLLEEGEQCEKESEEPKLLTYEEANLLENGSPKDACGGHIHSPGQVQSICINPSSNGALGDHCEIADANHGSQNQSPPPLGCCSAVHTIQASSPQQVDSPPRRKRNPCYGWLCSDDEGEPDLVYLTPAA